MSLWDMFSRIFDSYKTLPSKAPVEEVKNEWVDYGYKAGELTIKYECNNRGPGFISSGSNWGDPGGDSYGCYQIETRKGTMADYLNTVDDKFTKALHAYAINSTGFKNLWRKMAKEDPVGFKQSQFDFLANKPNGHYDGIKHAKSLGWNTNNLAMQSAIFSTVNQSGGWKNGIFNKAGIKSDDNLETQINKLYDARAAYFRRIKIADSIRNSIIRNRTVLERKDALELIGEGND